MRLRTFTAPTMSEAMQQIREALGDDAIIVSSHQSDRGRGVQITAAIEANDDAPMPASDAAAETIPDVETSAVVEEAPAIDGEQLLDSLLYHDVPPLLADRLTSAGVRSATADPVEALASSLDKHFDFQPLTDTARPVMLVGPAGAGKTITIAKMATAMTLRGEPATIISTDTVRSGAIAQLSGYTDILGLPLLSAETPEDLHAAILNNTGSRLLIDTPSTNPFNDDEMSDLGRFIRIADVDPILVLPAGMNANDAGDVAAAYARLGCRALVMTQLDATRRLGAILAGAYGGHLALSVVSISSSVASGLTPINPLSLARVLLCDPEESSLYATSGVNQA